MSTHDTAIIAIVIAARFLMPLLIPIIPLPAVVACLIIDGIDQTIFQTQLAPESYASIQDFYQGYDKAMDIFYLAIAFTAVLRNWTNHTAMTIATFLWFYRLAGVTLFETLHTTDDPSSFRWLLLIFPNTFEYFFIFYELVRTRWDPRRLSAAHVILAAWFIWVFIKIPQEYWIHIAQLDFTDFANANPWVMPTLAVLIAVAAAALTWAIRYRLPAADWRFKVVADPIPTNIDEADERAQWLARRKLFNLNLFEKVALVGLILVIFSRIMPGMSARPSQVVVATAVLLVINTGVGLVFARRAFAVQNIFLSFGLLLVINIAAVWMMSLVSAINVRHSMFFIVLLTLMAGLYDRYRPVHDVRFGHDGAPQPEEIPLGAGR